MQVLVLIGIGGFDKLDEARKSALFLHHVEDLLVVDVGEAVEQQHGCNDLKCGRLILLTGVNHSSGIRKARGNTPEAGRKRTASARKACSCRKPGLLGACRRTA